MDPTRDSPNPDAAVIADALKDSHRLHDQAAVLEAAENYPVTDPDSGDEYNPIGDRTDDAYDRGPLEAGEITGLPDTQTNAGTWGIGGGGYNRGTDTGGDLGFGLGSGTSPGSYGSGGSDNA